MLTSAHRLRSSADFGDVVRRGVRAGRSTVVVHALAIGTPPVAVPQVGFVVSKAVGNAVVRNRVKRRLRHLVVPHLPELVGLQVVVRALPPAAGAGAELGTELTECLATARRRIDRRTAS